jgi:hypothetical protein
MRDYRSEGGFKAVPTDDTDEPTLYGDRSPSQAARIPFETAYLFLLDEGDLEREIHALQEVGKAHEFREEPVAAETLRRPATHWPTMDGRRKLQNPTLDDYRVNKSDTIVLRQRTKLSTD